MAMQARDQPPSLTNDPVSQVSSLGFRVLVISPRV